MNKDEQIRQLTKALLILNDKAYKISESTYQISLSSKMKSEIENVLNTTLNPLTTKK